MAEVKARVKLDSALLWWKRCMGWLVVSWRLNKTKRMKRALEVFEGMPKRDLVSWTTMIMGFVSAGRAVEAIEMYRKMRLDGVEVNEVVMVSLAQAHAMTGDMRMGRSALGRIIRFGMGMDVMVKTSLVDMYAKMGSCLKL